MKDCEANGMKAEKCPAKLTTRRAEVWPTARGESWIPARRPLKTRPVRTRRGSPNVSPSRVQCHDPGGETLHN